MKTKTVLLPIEVPEGEWCWKWGHGCCKYLRAYPGDICVAGLWEMKKDKCGDGHRKPPECLNLKEVE